MTEEQVLEVRLEGKRIMRLEIAAEATRLDVIACFQVLARAFEVSGGRDLAAFSRYQSEDPLTGRAVTVLTVGA